MRFANRTEAARQLAASLTAYSGRSTWRRTGRVRSRLADKLVCLSMPLAFSAVGQWYEVPDQRR
jgi:predicted phosphoribosyltransferase